MSTDNARSTPAVLSHQHVTIEGQDSDKKRPRSRKGCFTCKKRKVKCDEQRPRCSNCERLNRECRWPSRGPLMESFRQQRVHVSGCPRPSFDDSPKKTIGASLPDTMDTQTACGVDELFDFASFMWTADAAAMWQLNNANLNLEVFSKDNREDQTIHASSATDEIDSQVVSHSNQENHSRSLTNSSDDEYLLLFFSKSDNPPLLAEVETKKAWIHMRQLVLKMVKETQMVLHAVLAFSQILVHRTDGLGTEGKQHYMTAQNEILTFDTSSLYTHERRREHLLASLFFLTYVDVLQSRLEEAHTHLNRAYSVFQLSCMDSLSFAEKKLFLWFRLLDWRCVSFGGDGLFLSQDHVVSSMEALPTDSCEAGGQSPEEETEGLVFQILCQSGIIFYQKVLGILNRISMIDSWHRSRGTVEDETEVMDLARQITKDLGTLYDARPALMDHAVKGRLTDQLLSPNLAFTLTRSFRTYLANFYAAKIQLHRVAYKSLPLTKEALEALQWIRQLLNQLNEAQGPDDVLPITMIWPLMMLGAEAQDPEEKRWTRDQILQTEKVASNAQIIAQVLEEVQSRQDTTGARMDIRGAMLDVFNTTFPFI